MLNHEKSMRLLTLGHGYTAAALAPMVLAAGGSVQAVSRDAAKLEDFAQSGLEPRLWNDLSAHDVQDADAILISAAPKDSVDPVLEAFGDYFALALPRLKWIGYLSTIAVYGDQGGAWVDEDTITAPISERGKSRVAAENAWLELPVLPVHVFRLGGIYGPGRGPFAKIKAGTAKAIIKPGQYFNRAHVEDMARALWLSMQNPMPGGIYNLVDDEPAAPQDVLNYAAHLMGQGPLPEEPFETAEMSPMARAFYQDNKRVKNAKTKAALGWVLKYSTYREGLEGIAKLQ